jgi:hypothetical protein
VMMMMMTMTLSHYTSTQIDATALIQMMMMKMIMMMRVVTRRLQDHHGWKNTDTSDYTSSPVGLRSLALCCGLWKQWPT